MFRSAIFFVAALLFLGACDMSQDAELESWMRTYVNDTTWLGRAEARLDAENTLTIIGIGIEIEDGVGVQLPAFAGVGAHALQAGQAHYSRTVGRDVLVLSAPSLGLPTDRLVITAYDTRRQVVRGHLRFEAEATEAHTHPTHVGEYFRVEASFEARLFQRDRSFD